MSSREERAARREALSGAGPTNEDPVPRFPGGRARFALFGEILMVGLLVVLTGFLLVTAPAALAAGMRHLRRFLAAEDSRLVLFWRDFRSAVVGGAVVGVASIVLIAVLVLDIHLAGSGALPGGVLVAAVGWVGLAVTGVAILMAASSWAPDTGWRSAFKKAPGMFAGDIVGSIYFAVTIGFVVVVTWMLPPLLIPALGCTTLAAIAIPVRPTRGRSAHSRER